MARVGQPFRADTQANFDTIWAYEQVTPITRRVAVTDRMPPLRVGVRGNRIL